MSALRAFPTAMFGGWLAAMLPVSSQAAPVLASAEARIRIESPTACTVDLTITIEGASQVEHRVEAVDGSRVELLQVSGAVQVGDIRTVGRTRSLLLAPGQPAYALRYRVQQPDWRRERCPLWLPTIPADGRSRNVHLTVELPAGAMPGGTMPGFRWTGERGETTLGHLPAFVRVAYAEAGRTPPWDVSRVMDVITLATLALASALWLVRKRARPRAGPAPAHPTGAGE
jgi:hypothetical protein